LTLFIPFNTKDDINRRTVAPVVLPLVANAIALGLFATIQDRLPDQVAEEAAAVLTTLMDR